MALSALARKYGWLVSLLVFGALGCGGDSPSDEPVPAPKEPGCGPGTLTAEDGSCIEAGIAPEACGEGFVGDDRRGCAAVVPDAPCGEGQMALMGETSCRDVASCAAGQWGDLPTDGATEFVDVGYLGTSDGSAERPWRTIQAGVDAAAAGAIVAVAAGSYPEPVVVTGQPVRLWGVCPGLVEVTGGSLQDNIELLQGASGSEIRGLSVAGGRQGIVLSGADDVVLDQLWIHGSDGYGVYLGQGSVHLSGSLIENHAIAAVVVGGQRATITGCSIRGGNTGWGLVGVEGAGQGARLDIAGVRISATTGVGILGRGADLTVSDSLIEGTRREAGDYGYGLLAQDSVDEGMRGSLSLTASVIERNEGLGIIIAGADGHVATTVSRDNGDRGVEVATNPASAERANATIDAVVVEGTRGVGMLVTADASVTSTILRDTLLGAPGESGNGLTVQPESALLLKPNATLRGSVVERSTGIGVSIIGADLVIEDSAVRDTARPELESSVGRGINVQVAAENGEPSALTLRRSLVETNVESGVAVIGATATIEDSTIRGTTQVDGTFGDGVVVLHYLDQPASLQARSVRVEGNARAGFASFEGLVHMTDCRFECNTIDLNGESVTIDFSFEDGGGNTCGCDGESLPCKVLSSGLQPPAAI